MSLATRVRTSCARPRRRTSGGSRPTRRPSRSLRHSGGGVVVSSQLAKVRRSSKGPANAPQSKPFARSAIFGGPTWPVRTPGTVNSFSNALETRAWWAATSVPAGGLTSCKNGQRKDVQRDVGADSRRWGWTFQRTMWMISASEAKKEDDDGVSRSTLTAGRPEGGYRSREVCLLPRATSAPAAAVALVEGLTSHCCATERAGE